MRDEQIQSIDYEPIERGWRLGRRRRQLDAIYDLLNRIDTALIVRDPGTTRSAEAFEGLRRQIIAAASDRRKHMVQLTELAESLRRGDNVEAIRSRSDEWMIQAGIAILDDPSVRDVFDNAGDWDGPLKVVNPAYIDSATGSVLRRGLVEPANEHTANPPIDEPDPQPAVTASIEDEGEITHEPAGGPDGTQADEREGES